MSAAITATRTAADDWRALSFDDRAAVLLRAAELLAGPWRSTLVAATMLGQSKSVHQAEIDICELIDLWRFNVAFARQIHGEQPAAGPREWNRVDYRPLEGFIYAVMPFNFTAIAGNLPTAPALMTVAENLAAYRNYPRLVGETGGKNFVLAHPSADVEAIATVLVRGAFVGTNLGVFGGAVIDSRSHATLQSAIERAAVHPTISTPMGGQCANKDGWFVQPTIFVGEGPPDEIFTAEYFGPLIAINVYDDGQYPKMLKLVEKTSPYGLTGSIVASDRLAIAYATRFLRFRLSLPYMD